MSQQMFTPGANTFARLSVLVVGLIVALVLTFIFVRAPSPTARAVGVPIDQPVRFSHELHSGQLNIECRYCHTAVEESSYAGIPPTETCMTCHSQIATYSELLEPVRQSYATGERLEWNQVHNLAQHVYFNHSIHVQKGVGCETCHGQVEQMPLVWRAEVMTMEWCLECHRNPAQFIRPIEEIYTVGWQPPEPQSVLGPQLVEAYHIDTEGLTNCSVCHR